MNDWVGHVITHEINIYELFLYGRSVGAIEERGNCMEWRLLSNPTSSYINGTRLLLTAQKRYDGFKQAGARGFPCP